MRAMALLPSYRRCLATPASTRLIELEWKHGAHNYKPLPVVLERGGRPVWDVDGVRYLDFFERLLGRKSGGHSHPKIVGALQAQASKLTLTSRTFHNVYFACEA